MKKRTATFLTILLVSCFLLLAPNSASVNAISCSTKIDVEDLDQKELTELESACAEKVDQLRGQIETLTGELNFLDSQIQLTEVRIRNAIKNIQSKGEKITQLANDISDLADRIVKIEHSISYQQTVLDQRLRERYKSYDTSPVMVILGSDTLDSLVKKTQYLKVMEGQDQKLIDQMGHTKTAYVNQKNLFEDTKRKEEDLKAQLEADKRNLESYNAKLASQKEEKNRLIEATQNSEEKYQELLADAKKQLQSFTSFVNTAGGGVIDSSEFGSGKGGWYMSQRDKRWASETIGNSRDTIFDVGCLLTDVAMIYKYYGEKKTPEDIANDNSRYFANTALMLIPWKGPKGRVYTSISVSAIKGELSKKNPVIVGIYYGAFGTHFVVLSSATSDGDYIMYDPYYGPDLKFSSRYSTSKIFQAVVFK